MFSYGSVVKPILVYIRSLKPDTSFSDIPSWVIVLATAAVVGSISAVAAVIGLARWRNSPTGEQRVPSTEAAE
jgi:hypothetical protein